MDFDILANGGAKLDPVDTNDVLSGGTSVDAVIATVVSATTGDWSAQFAVGTPGPAETADNGAAAAAASSDPSLTSPIS